jgi:predicted 2-oxoglutarate/Fe(II)-dependent dioxygenase YbiX
MRQALPAIVQNFIPIEDTKKLVDFFLKIEKPSPRENYKGSLGYPNSLLASQISMDNPVIPLTEDLKSNDCILKITDAIIRTRETLSGFYGLDLDLVQAAQATMYPGKGNELHSDSTTLDGEPLRDDGISEEMEYSAILYLNTCGVDFTGGEICFPKQDLIYKPEAGSLIHFIGNSDYIHEVTDVLSGKRVAIVMFFGKKGNVSVETFYY